MYAKDVLSAVDESADVGQFTFQAEAGAYASWYRNPFCSCGIEILETAMAFYPEICPPHDALRSSIWPGGVEAVAR
jgi:hypothetical protein